MLLPVPTHVRPVIPVSDEWRLEGRILLQQIRHRLIAVIRDLEIGALFLVALCLRLIPDVKVVLQQGLVIANIFKGGKQFQVVLVEAARLLLLLLLQLRTRWIHVRAIVYELCVI